MSEPTTQDEAAASGLYWFTRWRTGEIILCEQLPEAMWRAFNDVHDTVFDASTEERPTSLTLVVLRRHEAVAEVQLRDLTSGRNPWHGWSPANLLAFDSFPISPAEQAHLVRRRYPGLDAERIERAAIRHADGTVFDVPRPGRHSHVIALMSAMDKPFACPEEECHEQGFITNTGRFVDRYEARKIAEAAAQLIERAMNLPQLYSEDVW